MHATAVAHGSTGAGNDQVRFDVAFSVIAPNTEIITPIRDQKLSEAVYKKVTKDVKITDADAKKYGYLSEHHSYGETAKKAGVPIVPGSETLTSTSSVPT